MVLAWYMDNNTEADQRLPHKPEEPVYVTTDELKKLGIETLSFDPSNYHENPEFLKLKRDRGYSYQDEIKCSPKLMENYEKQMKIFYDEHIHTDEEIRLVLEGSGYFDVRDKNDKWIRIAIHAGDLLILPAGIYHRFTLDSENYVRALRLFAGVPVWTAHSRLTLDGDHPTILNYKQSLASA